ncbi:hypothetical protein ACVW0W_001407 [Bradyrhizobium sp. USDA 4469]
MKALPSAEIESNVSRREARAAYNNVLVETISRADSLLAVISRTKHRSF